MWRTRKTNKTQSGGAGMDPARISTSEGDSAERRLFPRLQCVFPVSFRKLLNPGDLFSGSLGKDVSASGVRVTTTAALSMGTRLVVEIALPGKNPHKVRAVSEVVWIKPKPTTGTYDHGLHFVELGSDDQNSLAGWVERGIVSSAA